MINTTLCYIEHDGKYLMLYRNKKKDDLNEGKWIGIGGKFEPGETPDSCMLREVFEETGIRLTKYHFHGIIHFRSEKDDEEMYLYTAKLMAPPKLLECNEGELAWIEKDKVLELSLWEGDRLFLSRLIAGDDKIEMLLRYEGDKLILSRAGKPTVLSEGASMQMPDYELLNEQLKAVSESSEWDMSILSNAAALLYGSLVRLNWCGFYLFLKGKLLLGPFQGKVACTVIEIGKGVCGTAAEKDETVLVPNVHEFPGHIACDSASNSEIVIPIHMDGQLYGVLDIDSPELNRFSDEDRAGLERLVKTIEGAL